jgi:hypothetical protein
MVIKKLECIKKNLVWIGKGYKKNGNYGIGQTTWAGMVTAFGKLVNWQLNRGGPRKHMGTKLDVKGVKKGNQK